MNVSIFTENKGDNNNRKKLVGISKVEPTDTFYTFTLYITSGGKRPVRKIATKAELRSALEDLIEVLEYNEMNEYIDCVQNAINAIM